MGDFNGSAQVHDFEPGIAASGLFWTTPIPTSMISAHPGIGRARFYAKDLAMPDYTNFFNAVGLADPPVAPVDSHVSFDVRWSGGGTATTVHDETFGFTGRFVDGSVSISFSVGHDGSDVTYSSEPEGQVTVSGGVGHERNGVFFH